MRKVLFIILSAVLMTLAASCGQSRVSRSLSHAEEIMEEHPDSALAILDSLPAAELGSDADRALHALLLTQAQIKNGYTVDSDTLIRLATAYYSDRDPSPRLMKSLFYDAKVKFNSSRLSEAIVPALEARDLAIEYSDPYWQAKSAELIADIYHFSYNTKESYLYTLESAKMYSKAGKVSNSRFSLCDLAVELGDMGKYKRALKLLDNVYSVSSEDENSLMLKNYGLTAKLHILMQLKRYDDAVKTLTELSASDSSFSHTAKAHLVNAEVLYNGGKFESYASELMQAKQNLHRVGDKAKYFQLLINENKDKGNSIGVIAYSDSLRILQNIVVSSALSQSVTSAHRDRYMTIATDAKEINETLRWWIVIVVLALILIVSSIVIAHRIIIKHKNKEIDKKVNEILFLTDENKRKNNEIREASSSIQEKINQIENLCAAVSTRDSNIQELKDLIGKSEAEKQKEITHIVSELTRERLSLINMLCSQYIDDSDLPEIKNIVFKNIQNELLKLRQPEHLYRYEETLNRYESDLVKRLRTQCRFLKERDIIFITLIFSGLSPKAVCMLSDIKLNNFYTKRRRLIERILESDAADKELFVSKLAAKH